MLRPRLPPRDARGLPVADPSEERIARAVVLVATVWFALAAGWELFGPLLAGHYASSASVGIIAENMLRWHIPGPVWEYTASKPGAAAYYCHHPWGIFWTTAALMKLLGRHDVVCRLAPALLSVATPPLLYALGRSIWRPVAGAAAAAAFVVLPITLAFASFNALEVPVIAWTSLALLGYVRLTQTGRRRYLAMALVGTCLALHADWPGFMLTGALLGFGLLRGYVLRPFFGPLVSERRYAEWWIATATLAVLTFLLYLALFHASGKLDDFFGSYGLRSSGNAEPLAKVLHHRRYWIELSFTPIAIALGKVGAVVALARLVVLRREHEALPLCYLLMAAAQYVIFKQGAEIHIFWPHYFGAFFALAMGALVATAASAAEWISARVATRRRASSASPSARPALVALGIAMAPLAAIARDGVPALRYAHETGGRFNEKGNLIHSDGAKTAFLRFVAPKLPRSGVLELHSGMSATWSQVWALGGRVVATDRPLPTQRPSGVYLADARFLRATQQSELAERFHVTAVGPFWELSPAEPTAPIDAFSFVEREPSWWEWYFVSGTEPHRDVVADPFATWELRVHFGQPAEAPTAPPKTLEQKRIAHNVAIAEGDVVRARALRAELEAELRPIHARFDDGSELLGAAYHEGARSLLTVYVLAGGPAQPDVQLTVASKVLAPARWSLTIADPTEREVGLPLAIPPERWRKGFLYADPVPIRKRPGTEVFRASYRGRGRGSAPKPVAGGSSVEVLRLE
jgi:hypothetical protein